MADDMVLDQVIRSSIRPNLDVIPSSNVAFGLENRLAGETLREKIFTRRMRQVHEYDFVLVDTSPAMSLLTVNTLLYVEVVVLTVSMDQMAIIGAVQSLAGLKRVLSAFESPEKKVLVLPTMVNAGDKRLQRNDECLAAGSGSGSIPHANCHSPGCEAELRRGREEIHLGVRSPQPGCRGLRQNGRLFSRSGDE